MSNCVCVPVAFQELLPRKSANGDLLHRLYFDLCGILMGGEAANPVVADTIPLGFEYQRDGKYACQLLEQRLKHVNKNSDLCIIDCTAYVSKVPEQWFVIFLIHISVYLADFWSKKKIKGGAVLLLPFFLQDRDPNWVAIVDSFSSIKGGLIIREDGEVAIVNGAWDNGKKAKYRNLIADYREQQRLTAIEAGTLRRVGSFAFSKPNRPSFRTCISIDGSKVQADLAKEILSRVTRERIEPFDVIVFHESSLSWMKNIRLYLVDRLGELSLQLPILSINSVEAFVPPSNYSKALVVTPLVDEGGTARALYDKVHQSGQKKAAVLALFSTRGDAPIAGNRIDAGLRTEYVLRVERRDEGLSQIFKSIPHQAATPDSFDLEPITLSSLSFWLMCVEAGFEHERSIPPERDSLGWVPRFGTVFKINAAWLAAKIAQLIDREKLLDVALLCPDEPNAKQLAATLRNVFNCGVIEIPRAALAEAASETNLSGLLGRLKRRPAFANDKEWISLLETLSAYRLSRAKVYIMDEFSVSRRTLVGLSNLAQSLQIQIAGAILLVDFLAGENLQIPHVKSLYRIPLDLRRPERPS